MDPEARCNLVGYLWMAIWWVRVQGPWGEFRAESVKQLCYEGWVSYHIQRIDNEGVHRQASDGCRIMQTWPSIVNISLGDIRFMPTRSEFAIFRGFFKFWSNAPNFRSVGGGGGMCMLFEICEKRLFQKCMGWGGGSQF